MRKILKTFCLCCLSFLFLFVMATCQDDNDENVVSPGEQEQDSAYASLTAVISDGLHDNWSKGDLIMLFHDGQTVLAKALESGRMSNLSGIVEGTFTDDNPLYGTYPADNMVSSDHESITVTVPAAQTDGGSGYDEKSVVSVARTVSDSLFFHTVCGGIKLNFQMSGVTKVELDAATTSLLRQYQKDPTEGNKQVLLEHMGIRYDKVVARKKAKLRELEREAKTPDLVEEMQAIVDEMVENREIRLEQQFLRLIDPRIDDNPDDAWMVLRGASAPNAYIGFAPVTNVEYAAFKEDFVFDAGKENYPVVNITIAEATAFCNWLTALDNLHVYRLPSDEEWILGAGHMPKDVSMNSGHVESGLTAVDAYNQTTGACGGIDFWGNCWEWTSSTDAGGSYIVKGGSWDSDRDACRSEKSDVVRRGSQGYANVGFRVVRVDSSNAGAYMQ